MAVWGKLLGAIFGFMFGGIFGALLGFILGHTFDTGLSNIESFNLSSNKIGQIKQEFFKATFSVMGHLARADGVVTPQEIKMATKLMDEMHLSTEQRMDAINLFKLGKQRDFDIDSTLKNLMLVCSWRQDLLQIFMEIQFQAAYSDGDIKSQEKEMLMYLCQRLGFSRIDYNRFDALYGYKYTNANSYQNTNDNVYNFNNHNASLDKAYKILGINDDITESTLKKAYRKLMSQHHPDKLIAKGLPDEMLKMATEKTQEIKWAYDQVRLAKGWG